MDNNGLDETIRSITILDADREEGVCTFALGYRLAVDDTDAAWNVPSLVIEGHSESVGFDNDHEDVQRLIDLLAEFQKMQTMELVHP